VFWIVLSLFGVNLAQLWLTFSSLIVAFSFVFGANLEEVACLRALKPCVINFCL
jgi:hypothetical protein